MFCLAGSPIDCIIKASYGGQFGKAVNTYCWIRSTYTLPSQREAKDVVGVNVAHPGVGPPDGEDDEKVYHAYYRMLKPLTNSYTKNKAQTIDLRGI
jgi:hypothetical protein